MNKKQAQHSISELFTKSFDLERYKRFLNNLLNRYEPRDGHYTGNYIPDAFKQHIKQYWRIGKYIDPEGSQLDLLVVEVKSLSKLERARSSLRNFAVNRLKQFEKEASLIAFYAEDDQGADWRFSYVKIEHEAYKDDKGKVKLKQELTPAKRYSYLVGVHENSHTASKQLLPLLEMDYADPRIDEIEAAFSIEKVTDEFFEQYKMLFQKLAEHLKRQSWFKKGSEEERDQQVSRFAKKLLGQIVFLYFLQKKRWLGVPRDGRWGEGSKRFMWERYDQAIKAGGNYYRDFLQYLFYEALADERKGQSDSGYYARFDCCVPFLNGGLFEADYDWRNEAIELPNTLFHNDEKNKNGDTGTGILDVFERYNFTVKEDEPLEKEVAVDPEMLGKVFENMLEVSERKSKGAFYTPREIVHYMCQESLIHYLDNRLNTYATAPELTETQGDIFGSSQQSLGGGSIKVPEADIEILIRKGHLALENDTRVLNAGKETRDYKFQLPESVRLHAKAMDEALADIKVCDPAIGSGAFPVGMLHEIVNARMALALHSSIEKSAYKLKRHAIGESLYGVDIDASAIDIARLRLWLSLIVDEEDYGRIDALPNLDYKIVHGDSLIGFPENWRSPAFDKIEELKKNFFQESDHDKKTTLKNKIDAEILQRMADSKKIFGWQVNFDFRLMFSEVWHQKNGFDVVIGNPPYGVSLKGDIRNSIVKILSKVPDYEIYYFFIERARRLLRDDGINSYIIPNTILFNVYAANYRQDIVKNWEILELLDCTPFPLFQSAVVRNVIYAFKKHNRPKREITYRSTSRANSFNTLVLEKKEAMPISDLLAFNQNWGLAFKLEKIVSRAIAAIVSDSRPLIDLCPEISQGLIAYDKYRGQSQDVIESRAYHYTEYHQGLKKWLKGEDITRYDVTWNGKHYIDYCDGIANPRDPKFFIGDRVLIREITNPSLYAGFTSEELYNDPSILIVKTNHQLHGLALEAILNSELATFYHFNSSPKATKGEFPKILITDIKNFPINNNYSLFTTYLVSLSKYIKELQMHIKNFKLQHSFFDQLSSSLVYQLYLPNEIKAANKDILSHIGDLKPISNEMTDEENLAVIQREFDRLYDPRHPVRNHLETLDSVEVVRTIREALQKK
jgi:predicted RNA methylase